VLLELTGVVMKKQTTNTCLWNSFPNKKKDFNRICFYFEEEAKRRDHRKLGKELELSLSQKVGQGLPLWLPKGSCIERLEQFEKHKRKQVMSK
jgi:threonyl-tRNA synthetase